MDLAADLSIFFNLDEFAVTAIVKNASDATVRTAPVIKDLPQDVVILLAGEVRSDASFVLAKTPDVADVRDGWKLVIGGTAYRVSGAPKRVDDGAMSIVEIRA